MRQPVAQRLVDSAARPPVSAATYPYTIPPVDQTRQEPALRVFLQKVLHACNTQREKEMLLLVDAQVEVSAGGNLFGKADFITYFLHQDHRGSGYARLRQAIRLGGTVTRDSVGQLLVTFPYLQDDRLYQRNRQLAGLALDPYISYVGIVPEVVIYQQPSRRSKQLAKLDYPVLLTSYDNPMLPGDWLRVVAADSSFRGYTQDSQLYCRADMTLTIQQKNGQFKITSVIPYD